MSQTECLRFEQKLAFHSAPSMLGIKPASMLSLSDSEFSIEENVARFNHRAKIKGLKIRILCSCKNRRLLLVYNEKLLDKQLNDRDVRKLLSQAGYDAISNTEVYLDKLSSRFTHCDDFPHEVGLFLGYPASDVMGFIENKGENYIFSGFWKVYSDAENAKRKFSNYTKCRDFLCNKLNQGDDIYHALKINTEVSQ